MKVTIIGAMTIKDLSEENKKALLEGKTLNDLTIQISADKIIAEDE